MHKFYKKALMKGIEDMPLRLLIIVIVLAIILPIIFELFISYDNNSTYNSSIQTASTLANYIHNIYSSNVNSSMNVQISFHSGFYTKITKVIIGDSLKGQYSSTIRVFFNNRAPLLYVIDNPNVKVSSYACNNTWQGLTIGGDQQYTLHLVDEQLPSGYGFGTFVEISVISPTSTC